MIEPEPHRPGARLGAKGERRRAEIISAAAELVAAGGPAALTHRRVAEQAGASLSATTYYFRNRDDLLAAAGRYLMGTWAEQAEQAAAQARREAGANNHPRDAAAALVSALLPSSGVAGHYAQLIEATASPPLTASYRDGRARLDAAISDVLGVFRIDVAPSLVLATVDGAVVAALSEGLDPRRHAKALLESLLAVS